MGFGMQSEGMRTDICHHRSSARLPGKGAQYCNIIPLDSESRDKKVLYETSREVIETPGEHFIYQAGWIFHHYNRTIGRWTVSVVLRKEYAHLFEAYYKQKKEVITLGAKKKFEEWDIKEIKLFLKKEGVNLVVEKPLDQIPLANDTKEKIAKLASDVLSGKR
ncbi:MAG: hypothetical protein ACD_78C00442G0003 [uncultured bacterium (gcode 4)]|uniref:Uncharacterized protein n=1 Tax=uncultured bacterium (gcode 4) TaxID=1234023 RepID=K1YA65_9BACT|nr:MAG: hypothetical protein ACD_78C00442G0003 [uncultured bacterium (gcode 4)]